MEYDNPYSNQKTGKFRKGNPGGGGYARKKIFITMLGFCKCGCGYLMPVLKRNRYGRGAKRGEPWYILGHRRTGQKGPYLPIQNRCVISENGCWLWQGYTNFGYAYGNYKGKKGRVHKIVFEEKNGKVPVGMVLDHLCRIKHCVNPDHLEVVTSAINTRRGLLSKLSDNNVEEIIEATRIPEWGQYAALARKYRVSPSLISMIAMGKRWAEGHTRDTFQWERRGRQRKPSQQQ